MKKFTVGNARFTVVGAYTVRMEYAQDACFCDSSTLFADRQNHAESAETPARMYFDNDCAVIETENFTLYYKGGRFAPETLWVKSDLAEGGVWRFGDNDGENLGGTLHTLDGVDGFRRLPDGLLSRRGCFLIDDSGAPVLENGWIENRSPLHITDAYLFVYGKDYKGALRSLANISGKFELPRKYFFGSWYSRWHRYTSEEFLSIVDEYDSHGFPLDVLVMDMDWHYHDWGHTEGDPRAEYGYGHAGGNMGWTGYTWNRRVIPDPKGLIDELHRRGVAVTLNDHPCDGVRDHEECYPVFIDRLHKAGYREQVPDVTDKVSEREKAADAKNTENYRFNAGSKDYMDAFFAATDTTMENIGADFRWLDWQQDYIYPYVNGVPGLTHLRWLNHLYYEHSKGQGKRGMMFSRWGGFGDQKHPAYFSGDSVSNWETLEFEVQMTASAGNAGCFWWSHDIGGFHDPVEGGQSELYARWVQFGAMSPALRVHVCGDIDRRPWKWGEPFCSAMREAFRLRACLMPYIYSAAWQSSTESLPLLRPLYLESPDCEEAYRHPSAYYFGDSLLVYPVCSAGEGDSFTAKTDIWLPEGKWYGWFDGKCYNGGFYTAENDLFTFPLFVKAHSPIVTRPYTSRMAKDPLTEAKVIIYCGDGDTGNEYSDVSSIGTARLFEDDGISEAYKDGVCRVTKIRYEKREDSRIISFIPEGNGYEGEPQSRAVTVELRDCSAADSVTCICGETGNSGESPDAHLDPTLEYDGKSRTARITVRNISPAQSFEIKVK